MPEKLNHFFSILLKNAQKPEGLNSNKQSDKDKEEIELLIGIADEYNVNPSHIRELMVTEKEYVTFLRRRNILDDIQKKIEKFATEIQ